ncbi:MAG TPA: histidine kinase dimerization/phosphoacceptor domain -containing protein [Roseococcus sp.]|nr:histidine kinase dimerization/phosphoacceptor domain -containing protein [Roseococcus sp.]
MLPPSHPRQPERLAALRRTGLLDTPRERDFDEIVALAARICDTPIAVVNLIDADRQWFKAEIGLGVAETPLDTSICAHIILQEGVTVVEDAAADPRLADNPLVTGPPGLRFYAGARLDTAEGLPLGTLCVLDTRPRALDPLQREALVVLARQVVSQIELRMALREESALREALEAAEAQREVLVREVDHRVKNSLQMVASLLRIQSHQAATDEVAAALDYAQDRIAAIGRVHEALQVARDVERVDLDAFLARIMGHLAEGLPPGVTLDSELAPHATDARGASAFGVAVNELVANAGRHAFPGGSGRIRVRGEATAAGYRLTVEDDGVGMPDDVAPGGLGLAIVAAAAQRLGGTFDRAPSERGTCWTLLVPPMPAPMPAPMKAP